MPLPKVPKKLLPKLTSVFLLLYVAATLPWFTNRLTSFAYIVQAIVQSDQKAENEATQSIRQAIQHNSWDATLYAMLGSQLSSQDKVEEAIAAYRQAIRLYPEYDLVYRLLGEALIKQGKPDEAIATYRQAIKVNPQWTWAYNELGNRLYYKWKFDEAIAVYRQAIQINPNYGEAYNNLGNTLSYQGKPKEAIAAYRQAIQINPNYGEAYSSLGWALQQQGRLDEAIAAYHQAIQIYPNYAEAYNNLGNALFNQSKPKEAIAAYRQAIQIEPNYAVAYNYLAWTLQQQGKFEEALEVYKKASALPQNYRNVNLFLQETERLLTMQKNPQLLASPERLPSLKNEPLVLLKRSVVRVFLKRSCQLYSGTGWVVKRQGNKAWVVTNRHVATAEKNTPQSDLKIEVEFYSEPHSGEVRKRKPAKIAKITAASDKLDLALLEVTDIPKDIQPLARSSTPVALNAPIRIIGYPYTTDYSTVATGEVINQTDEELRMSAISAPGNSGSPVLDQQNRVVGVVWGSSSTIQIQNQQLERSGSSSGSALAFPIQSVTRQLKDWGID
ncbi:tetratricopeptide repeat protein [Microcoleus sp. AT3-D2]|uniref:tetratricopeptide repeat protein n=1 Tax=Microcoleus sp. AT3-D2 TaxID=2818612 RepID=UPI002FD2373D